MMNKIKCQYCDSFLNTQIIQFYEGESIFKVCNKCIHQAIKDQSHLRGKIAYSFYPENFYLYKKIPVDFLNANNWTITDNQKFMLQNWNMIKKRDFGKGVIFSGKVGVGKTYMLYSFMRDVCMYAGKRETILFSEYDFFEDFKIRMNNKENQTRNFIEKVEDHDMIFYDDLGSQIQTVSGGWGKQKLFELLKICSDEDKPIIITTNLKSKDFLNYFDSRIADRLFAMEFIEIRNNESLREPASQKMEK